MLITTRELARFFLYTSILTHLYIYNFLIDLKKKKEEEEEGTIEERKNIEGRSMLFHGFLELGTFRSCCFNFVRRSYISII